MTSSFVKKSLVLAVLGSLGSLAYAQSSVQLYGIVDAAIRHTNNEGGRIQTRSATPVDSVNEGGVLRAVDQQFSVHSQR